MRVFVAGGTGQVGVAAIPNLLGAVSNRKLKSGSSWRPEYPTLSAGLGAMAADLMVS